MTSQRDKTTFNRRLGFVTGSVIILGWLGTLAVRFVEPDKDAKAAGFVVPVLMLWVAFLLTPVHETDPDEDRYAMTRRALVAFAIMEAITAVVALVS